MNNDNENNKKELLGIIEKFPKLKAGVIGDIMLDHFIWGKVTRISPEAPVPVVFVKKEFFSLGGAGNVANNISSLGAKSFLFGITGNDISGRKIKKLAREKKVDAKGIFPEKRKTTKKTRVAAENQQIVRFDEEDVFDISKDTEKKIIKFLAQAIKNLDILIVSDYAKGLMTKNLAKKIISLAKKSGKKIIVDSKPQNYSFFKNVDFVTPNEKEAALFTDESEIEKMGPKMKKDLNCQVLVTRGPRGMALFEKRKKTYLRSRAREVFDVSGAGDTVSAVFSLSLASGASPKQAAFLANTAAAIAVGKSGTASVYLDELRKQIIEQ